MPAGAQLTLPVSSPSVDWTENQCQEGNVVIISGDSPHRSRGITVLVHRNLQGQQSVSRISVRGCLTYHCRRLGKSEQFIGTKPLHAVRESAENPCMTQFLLCIRGHTSFLHQNEYQKNKQVLGLKVDRWIDGRID